jgi:hypothetical protein
MAIRNPTSQDKATISVFTVDKRKYIDCDIPAQPFALEGMVQFWDDKIMVCIPMAQIARIELNFNESS